MYSRFRSLSLVALLAALWIVAGFGQAPPAVTNVHVNAGQTTTCGGSGPCIQSLSGTISNGSSLTITGQNFGSKSTPAVYMDQTYESGNFLSPQEADPYGTIGAYAGKQRHQFSTMNNRTDFTPGPGSADTLDGASVSLVWYISEWFMLDTTWKWPTCPANNTTTSRANLKTFVRFWSPSSQVDDSSFFQNHHGQCVGNGGDYNELSQGSTLDPNYDLATDWALGTWYHVEIEWTDETTQTSNDGKVKLWFDGVLKMSGTGRNTKSSNNFSKRPYILGIWDSWSGNNGTAPNYLFQDDFYVDHNTLARVFIANGSTYLARGQSEIQKPTAWASGGTSVTVNLFQGAFSSMHGKYLYVCDSTGTCNANGFLIP